MDAIKRRKNSAPYTLPSNKRLSHQAYPHPHASYNHMAPEGRRYWDRPLPDKPESESEDSDVVYMQRPGSVHSGYNSIRTVRVDVVAADGETGQPLPRDDPMMTSATSVTSQYIPADRRSISSNHSSGSRVYENEVSSPQRRPHADIPNGKRHSVIHKRLSQLSQGQGHMRANSDGSDIVDNNHAARPVKPQVPVKPVYIEQRQPPAAHHPHPANHHPSAAQPLLKTMRPNGKNVRYDIADSADYNNIHRTA